jgi:hypothetical protein
MCRQEQNGNDEMNDRTKAVPKLEPTSTAKLCCRKRHQANNLNSNARNHRYRGCSRLDMTRTRSTRSSEKKQDLAHRALDGTIQRSFVATVVMMFENGVLPSFLQNGGNSNINRGQYRNETPQQI